MIESNEEKLPLVSAIIPVHNGERHIAEAIGSVLDQDYPELELIIVDDGSTDGTAEQVRRHSSIRYHYQENSGTGSARNAGLQLARGEFIAFLDSDDLWMPGKIRRQVSVFAENPALDIVTGMVQQFHSPELDDDMRRRIHCPPELMTGMIFGCSLIHRRAFDQVGLVQEQYLKGENVDWFVRAHELKLPMHVLPELLMRRRLHDSNHSIKNRDQITDFARLLKASLDRRRAAQRDAMNAPPRPNSEGT